MNFHSNGSTGEGETGSDGKALNFMLEIWSLGCSGERARKKSDAFEVARLKNYSEGSTCDEVV